MSFPRYPKYKDSGVEWLGEVPEGWKILPLYGVAVERNESNKGMIEVNLLSLSYGRIVPKDIDSNDGLLPDSFETYQVVRPGDIVLRLTDLQNDKRSLRSALVEEVGIITSAYVAVAPRSVNSTYLSYLLRAYDANRKVFYSMGGGLRQSMKFGDLKRMPTLLPTDREQAEVAVFLGRETAKTDELIAEQRRLLELLKEKRQAVISHAVTKGLNPDAPMKPSGIEWLGEVPAHWQLLRLKNISPRISGRLVYQPAQYFAADGVPFLMGNNVTERGIKWDDSKFIPVEVNENFSQHALREGDVITVRVGAPGVTCVVPKDADGLNCGSLMIIRRSPRFDSDWLSSVMNSPLVRTQIDQVQYGAAQEQINITDAVNFLIATPPLGEQGLIAGFVQDEAAKFDALLAETQRAIDLLQERRTALISAAVTGQIDVRGLAHTAAA